MLNKCTIQNGQFKLIITIEWCLNKAKTSHYLLRFITIFFNLHKNILKSFLNFL